VQPEEQRREADRRGFLVRISLLLIARTLRSHRELLLNYFKAKKEFSSGVVEGLNNKAKVTMRRSYGFRIFRILELALYHSLGRLPEPTLTHEFF
jgi:transposase